MTQSELDRKARLWDAINRYTEACGGDPAHHVYGNIRRMDAVVEVEHLIACRLPEHGPGGRIETALDLLDEEFGSFLMIARKDNGDLGCIFSRVDDAFLEGAAKAIKMEQEEGRARLEVERLTIVPTRDGPAESKP